MAKTVRWWLVWLVMLGGAPAAYAASDEALALIAGHIEGSRDRALRALRAQPIVM
jgi:hypothetical protein